jgi:hypothetical protein
MIAGEDDDRIVQHLAFLERCEDAPETVIDREKHLEPPADLLVGRRGLASERRQVPDSPQQRGLPEWRLKRARTPRHGATGVSSSVSFSRYEPAGLSGQRHDPPVVSLDDVGMNRFVSKVDEERPAACPLHELLDVVRQQVRHVAGGFDSSSVHIELRIDCLALSRHRDPMIEARTRTVVVTHVPLAEERRQVTGALKLPRKGRQLMARPRRVVDDAVRVGVLAGQKVRPARRAERRRRERVEEPRALTGEPIHVRRVDERMSRRADLVPAEIVDEYDNDVGGATLWRRLPGARGRCQDERCESR